MAKKPAPKPAKKTNATKLPAKSKAKKVAPAKAVRKKPAEKKKLVAKKTVVKKKIVVIQAKKKIAAKTARKPVAKPAIKQTGAFSIKSAADKLRSAFAKKPAVIAKSTAQGKKTISQPNTKTIVKPIAKPAVVSKAPPVAVPKGILTEDRIRKMSDKEYMNDSQLAFFRYRLLQMRNEVLARELDVKERLHQREVFADPADRATAEEEHWLDLRLRERESLLLRKIDDALRRIADREFGYCEKTGDAIGIPRLLARPTATVCVDVKGQDERIESQFRDR
jgi:DnaK suppressor protein